MIINRDIILQDAKISFIKRLSTYNSNIQPGWSQNEYVNEDVLEDFRGNLFTFLKKNYRNFLITPRISLSRLPDSLKYNFEHLFNHEKIYNQLINLFINIFPRDHSVETPYKILTLFEAIEDKCNSIAQDNQWPLIFNFILLPIFDTLCHLKRAIIDPKEQDKETSSPYGEHVTHTFYVAWMGYKLFLEKEGQDDIAKRFRESIRQCFLKKYLDKKWTKAILIKLAKDVAEDKTDTKDINECAGDAYQKLEDLYGTSNTDGIEHLWFITATTHDLGYFVSTLHSIFYQNKFHNTALKSLKLLPSDDYLEKKINDLKKSAVFEAFKLSLSSPAQEYLNLCLILYNIFLNPSLDQQLYNNFWEKMGSLHPFFSSMELLKTAADIKTSDFQGSCKKENELKLVALQYTLILSARAVMRHHFLAWGEPEKKIKTPITDRGWRVISRKLIDDNWAKDLKPDILNKKRKKIFDKIFYRLQCLQRDEAQKNNLSLENDPLAYLLIITDTIEEFGEIKTVLSPSHIKGSNQYFPIPLLIKRAPDHYCVIKKIKYLNGARNDGGELIPAHYYMKITLCSDSYFGDKKSKRFELFEKIMNNKYKKQEIEKINTGINHACPIFIDLPYETRRFFTEAPHKDSLLDLFVKLQSHPDVSSRGILLQIENFINKKFNHLENILID